MYSTKTSFRISFEKNGHHLEGDYELDHVRILAEERGKWEMHTLDISGLCSSAGARRTTKDKAAIVRFGASKLYTGRI